MADTRLNHFDARFCEALDEGALESCADLGCVRGERVFAGLMGIVGVLHGDGAEGGLALDIDVAYVVIHLEEGFGGVADFPDHDGADFDGVAL